MKLKPGRFYRSKNEEVWCCFSFSHSKDLHCQADCVRVRDGRVEYFFEDGRYDGEGKREHTLVLELGGEHGLDIEDEVKDERHATLNAREIDEAFYRFWNEWDDRPKDLESVTNLCFVAGFHYANKDIRGLNHLRDEVHATAREKGWHDGFQTVPEAIALIHSEVSEAFEDYRNGEQPHRMWYAGHLGERLNTPKLGDLVLKPCGIPSEMADIIIRVLDFCALHGIDIEKAIAEKMAFNRTRPHRHGGKVL
jgi:NTP pyrophosphatase (non-canonical NTP hydrolase)